MLGLTLATLGCGSAEQDDDFGATPSSGSSSASEDPCEAQGLSCACEAGLSGTYVCEEGELACDCSECPDLEPSVEFTACQGDVLGTWRLVGTRADPGSLSFLTNTGDEGQCMATFNHGGTQNLRIEFRDGGEADLVASESYSETVVFASDCVSTSCAAITFTAVSPFATSHSLNDGSCDDEACNTCKCASLVSNDEVGVVEWEFVGSLLQIGSGDLSLFSYCVDGPALTLRKANVHYDFEAVDLVGTPTACAERSPGFCGVGEGCGLGVCRGTSADCELATEDACPTLAGCAWDPEGCGGAAPSECTLEDGDIVPGCELEPL